MQLTHKRRPLGPARATSAHNNGSPRCDVWNLIWLSLKQYASIGAGAKDGEEQETGRREMG